jgi:hypothetical protein
VGVIFYAYSCIGCYSLSLSSTGQGDLCALQPAAVAALVVVLELDRSGYNDRLGACRRVPGPDAAKQVL